MVQEGCFLRHLLSYWVALWRMLKSGQRNLLLFATYKNIGATYWHLFVLFGWFFALLVFFSMHRNAAAFLPFLSVAWSVITVWTVRPSVCKKTYCYFGRSFLLMSQAVACGLLFVTLHFFCGIYAAFFLGFGISAPLYIFFSFFVSDSFPEFSLKMLTINIKNSFIMLLANLPLILVIALATESVSYMLSSLYYGSELVLFPAFACIMNTLYVHARYEQRELYRYE